MLSKLTHNRTIVFLLVGSMIVSGCSGALTSARGKYYLYTYGLEEPVKNETLTFRDAYIIIQFTIDESAVNFQLQNISEASMSIEWDRVSLGVNKRVFSVRNTSTLYSTSFDSPRLVIPPLGFIRETVIPRENVFIKDGKWVEKDFFLTNDRGSQKLQKYITRTVGSELSLTIPIKIGEVVVNYPFVFKVKKAQALPPNLLPPVKQRPPAPKVPGQEMGSQIIPILIAAGIFGVAIYVLSKDKTPAADL
ncbi:MAG: hypothetical protein WCT99_12185 [Bacteroidota bacterium]|jgi:hypothetical protein